jgi:hypothetical protein
VAAAALGAVGCGGAPVRVYPYDPAAGAERPGAVYFLPKSRIEVAFNVKLEAGIDDAKCEQIVAECKYRFGAPEIADVTISTQHLPDPKAGFVIDTNRTFVSTTDFAGTFSPKGELTAATAFAQDHTIEFITEGLEALSKVAGVVAMAGPTQAATLQAQFKRRRVLLTLLGRSDSALAETRLCLGSPPSTPHSTPPSPPPPAPNPKTKTDIKPLPVPRSAPLSTAPPPVLGPCVSTADLQKTLELRVALLAEIQKLDEQLHLTRAVHIVCAFEPPKRIGHVEIRREGGMCPAYAALKLQLAQGGFDVPLPTLVVQWASANLHEKGSATEQPRSLPLPPGSSSYAGLVYRIPEWFAVTVSRSLRSDTAGGSDVVPTTSEVVAVESDLVAIAGDVVPLPQFGRLVATSFDEADMRSGRELKIELHEGQGSLKTLAVKNTPIKPEQVLRAVDAAVAVKQAGRRPEVDETTRLQNETKRVLAEQEYLEALKHLEEIKHPRASESGTPTKRTPVNSPRESLPPSPEIPQQQ